jgi:hypothetical protein
LNHDLSKKSQVRRAQPASYASYALQRARIDTRNFHYPFFFLIREKLDVSRARKKEKTQGKPRSYTAQSMTPVI